MRFTDVLAASLVAAPLVAAHGDLPGLPRIFGLGRSGPARLRAERGFESSAKKLQARQGGLEGRCGAEFGGASCAAGYCCSSAVSYLLKTL